MDRDHASFGSTLHLSELLDYLAVGRIREEKDPSGNSASRDLLSCLDGHGYLIRPQQYDG